MESVLIRTSRLGAYAPALPILALLAVCALAIYPTWPPLVETWIVMPDYSQAELLVPLIVCWVVTRSDGLPRTEDRFSGRALAVLFAALVAWLIAYRAASAIGEQIMLPPILWSALWMAFGLPIASRFAAPIACLYFAIPIWEFLVPLLQSATVAVSEHVLGWIGVPVHIDGVLINIPEGTFRIAEGCSGRRYFVVCLTVAALFAGSTRMRPWKAAAFLYIAAALAVLTNWLRVVTVIYAGHVTHMTSYLVAREHISFGWALFAIVVVIICLIGRQLAGPTAPRGDAGPSAFEMQRTRELFIRPALLSTALLLGFPLAGIAYTRIQLESQAGISAVHRAIDLPAAGAPWLGPYPAGAGWTPEYRGADALGRALYVGPVGQLKVVVAQYDEARRGAKLISTDNMLVPNDWMRLRRGALGRISSGLLPARPAAIWAKSPDGRTWLISYLYSVDRVATTSPITAQLAYGVLSWKGRVRSRAVAVASQCLLTCVAEQREQVEFWKAVGVPLLSAR